MRRGREWLTRRGFLQVGAAASTFAAIHPLVGCSSRVRVARPAPLPGVTDLVIEEPGIEIGGRDATATALNGTVPGPLLRFRDGEEVALRPGVEVRVDPRDAARTPMTWTRTAPNHGFTTGTPWIPFGYAPAETSVEAQDSDPDSMLSFYRSLLAFRRGHRVWGTGTSRLLSVDDRAIVAFVRENEDERYLVTVNLAPEAREGADPEAVSRGGRLVFGEGRLTVDGDTTRIRLGGHGHAVFELPRRDLGPMTD